MSVEVGLDKIVLQNMFNSLEFVSFTVCNSVTGLTLLGLRALLVAV